MHGGLAYAQLEDCPRILPVADLLYAPGYRDVMLFDLATG